MMTPVNQKYIEESKENRLSYLAAIPIASFNNDFDVDEQDQDNDNKQKSPPKSKVGQNVRFDLSSQPSPSSAVSQTKTIPKQRLLTQDFLHNFPLLRALVEEALTLQEHQYDIPIPVRRSMIEQRPRSAGQQGPRKLKQSPTRPKSATNIHSVRTKSVIVPRNINNTRRLYPPPSNTRHNVVTKHEVRNLVDRLSKPKFNKRVEREIAFAEQMITTEEPVTTPRMPSKPTSALVCFSNHYKSFLFYLF